MKECLLKAWYYIKSNRTLLLYLLIMLPLMKISYSGKDDFWSWDMDLTTYTVFTTVIFAFFAYVSNTYNNRGILFFKIIETNNKQYLEITNVGGFPIYNVELKIYDIYLDSKELFFANKEKFDLKQGDLKYLLLEGGIKKIKIKGAYSTKGGMIPLNEYLSKGDSELLSNITNK